MVHLDWELVVVQLSASLGCRGGHLAFFLSTSVQPETRTRSLFADMQLKPLSPTRHLASIASEKNSSSWNSHFLFLAFALTFRSFWSHEKKNLQSLEHTQVEYISQKYTWDKYTFGKYTFGKYIFWKLHFRISNLSASLIALREKWKVKSEKHIF